MTKFHYLTLAYTLFWLVMGFYMLGLGRRLRSLSQALLELKRPSDPGRRPDSSGSG